MIKPLLFAAAMLIAAPAAAKLSAAETRIVQTVEQERARTLGLLERMVNQNSGTLNLAGVEAVGRIVRAELEPLGFDVRWVPMAETGRAGHLIATRKGRAGTKRILMIGHLDTVFEADSPFQKFERRGYRAIGPGVDDDKGGLAVMIAALRAMQAAGTLNGANIEIVLTGDEERPGTPLDKARADLIAAGKRADVALDFEGLARENGRDMGSIARRSASSWELVTKGRGAHSSGVFGKETGDGAIYEMARILAAFRSELPEPNLTFNVGVMAGGTEAALDEQRVKASSSGKTNIVAAKAVARGDLRTLSEEQSARVREKMQAIVARHLNGTEAELRFLEDGYPPMAPTAGSRAYLAQLNAINRDLGLAEMGELDPAKRGAGDISFVARDVDGLIGLGTAGEGSHAPGEDIEIASLDRQAKRAAILMSRLARERR